MTEYSLYERLALERCRCSVAQLSAVVGLSSIMEDDAFAQTFCLLIQDLNRDLAVLEAARQCAEVPAS